MDGPVISLVNHFTEFAALKDRGQVLWLVFMSRFARII